MKPIHTLLFAFLIGIFACQSQSPATLDAKSFNEKINATPDGIILDVRTPEEFANGFIAKATNLNYNNNEFQANVNKLDKNKTYFVYCLSGGRSGAAANYMRSNGFKNVYDLKGGIMAWQNNNFPLTTTNEKPVSDKISKSDFENLISSHAEVLIDFYAPWCIPCQKMEPMLNELSNEQKKVKIVRLNIDENKTLAKELAVAEIPLFKLYKNGKETWNHKGIIEKEALKLILEK